MSVGTFGRPYEVAGAGFARVTLDFSVPGIREQDVVVVDLASPARIGRPEVTKASLGEPHWWMKPRSRVIDPRPLAMHEIREYADRIYAHGGIFVIFGTSKFACEYLWAAVEHGALNSKGSAVSTNNWSLLSALNEVGVQFDLGSEVNSVGGDGPLHDLMHRFQSEMSFSYTMAPVYPRDREWLTLATNKYGQAVACAIRPQDTKGMILIFPEVVDQSAFLKSLFQEVLPELSPQLFPESTSGLWLRGPDYELHHVLELSREIMSVKEAAHRKIVDLHAAIEAERVQNGFMHDLLTGTGDTLVLAVKRALETLGFSSVINSDLDLQPGQRRREDLQIHDSSPILLLESKGIAGLPKEEDSIQVFKYIAPRMREWNRSDVKGLAVINHQRNVPALGRNPLPFSEDVLTNALDQGFGLMTTWDLFRLLRSFLKLSWSSENVKPLFYQSGSILPIPANYELAGTVERYAEKLGVVSIRLSSGIRVGDTLAYELPIEFEEEIVGSLEIDNSAVEAAAVGALAGMKTRLLREQARKGTRVFRITEKSS